MSQAPGGQKNKTKADNSALTDLKVDTCALLTSADVQAIQGEPVKEAKLSFPPGSDLVLTQCFFHTPTPVKSVTVLLATPDPAKPSGLRRFWQTRFHASPVPEQKQSKGSKEPPSEAEGENKPHPISGIGDEAYWIGNPLTGALYVLRGNTFLRISVGGVREESVRIERSKALARAALKRLWSAT